MRTILEFLIPSGAHNLCQLTAIVDVDFHKSEVVNTIRKMFFGIRNHFSVEKGVVRVNLKLHFPGLFIFRMNHADDIPVFILPYTDGLFPEGQFIPEVVMRTRGHTKVSDVIV